MRVTVCELPHLPATLALAWEGLCEHVQRNNTELVLLPEFAMVEPVWENPAFSQQKWSAVEALSNVHQRRLGELGAKHAVGTRPVTIDGRRFNQGFIWSAATGAMALRSKHFMPDEEGGWEARWFERGPNTFPAFTAGELTFGLNICSEMWALNTYGEYAQNGVQAILSPRATASATTQKWLSVAIAGAVRAGAYSLSSNRVDRSGVFGGVGWIIDPDGQVLARTTRELPHATIDIDLTAPATAKETYPRYVFK